MSTDPQTSKKSCGEKEEEIKACLTLKTDPAEPISGFINQPRYSVEGGET